MWIVFCVLMVLPAFAVRAQCLNPDQAYSAGTIVDDSNVTVCEEAARIGVDCELLSKALVEIQGLEWAIPAIVTLKHLSFVVPTERQFDSLRAVMQSEAGNMNTFSVSDVKSHAPAAKSVKPLKIRIEDLLMVDRGRPFSVDNYTGNIYAVAPGDNVVTIAKKFDRKVALIQAFNDLPNTAIKVDVGTDILIPINGYTFWFYQNVLPFKNRDPEKLFRDYYVFGSWNGVVDSLMLKIKREEFTKENLVSGQYFAQSVSGDYKVSSNVIGAWGPLNFVAAKVYRVRLIYIGRQYDLCVAKPDKCYNWSWWMEDVNVSVPPVLRTPPDTSCIPDTVWRDTTSQDTVVEDWPDVDRSPLTNCGLGAIPSLDIWALHDFPAFGFFRHGAGSYGLKWDQLFKSRCSSNLHAFGFTVLADGWDGESRSGFNYYGFEACAGPRLLLGLSPKAYLGLEACLGAQWDWGIGGKGYEYEGFQTGGFFRPGLTFDLMGRAIHWSTWASGKVSFAENKVSTLNGVQQTFQQDPPNDKAGVDGGMRWYFIPQEVANPLIVWRESWAYDDGAVCSTIGAGVRLWQTLIIETSFKNRSNGKYDDSNGNAFELLANLSFGHGKSKSN